MQILPKYEDQKVCFIPHCPVLAQFEKVPISFVSWVLKRNKIKGFGRLATMPASPLFNIQINKYLAEIVRGRIVESIPEHFIKFELVEMLNVKCT